MIAALVLAALVAQQTANPGRLERPIVYSIPGMDAVEVRRDLAYRPDAGVASLLMDVYTPPGLARGERRPAVLFLHGSALLSQKPKDWGVFQSYGRLAAASGLAGVTLNQRAVDKEKGPQDVESAIAYVRTHAEELHVDADRLALVAFSAGGPLLGVALRNPAPYFRCLAAMYAILDTAPQGRVPPIFIARAGKDTPFINRSIDQFVQEAVAANVELDFVNVKDAPHAFDIQTPTPRVREAIARLVDFLKKNLER